MLPNFKRSWVRTLRSWVPDSSTTTKIRLNAFILVFFGYCIEFQFYKTKWYADNYYWIDYIDTAIMFVVIYDAFIKKTFSKYDDANIIAVCLFCFVIALNLSCQLGFLSLIIYYSLYKITLIIGAIALFLLKLESKL
jgi:hypothetical protein